MVSNISVREPGMLRWARASLRKPAHPLRASRCCQLSSPAASQVAVWQLLQEVHASSLDRPAVVACGESGPRLSHRELRVRSLAFAGRLTRDLGYAAGDKLALVLGGNCVESIITQLAAAAAGLTVVTAATAEDTVLEGCRGMVVSSRVLQGRSPLGLLVDEQHPPIVAHDESGASTSPLLWQDTLDCTPMDTACAAADHNALLAVYGGAKASEKRQTQGQITHMAARTAARMRLSNADRVALGVPLDSPFGFAAGALAGEDAPPSMVATSSRMRARLQDVSCACVCVRARAHACVVCMRARARAHPLLAL
jgi:hypothetical protein